MPKGKIGFEQLNENLQQKIQLGGSGSGGGVGFLKNTVKITANTNTVRIGLYFKAGTDALLVFKNSTYQELNHDYIIDESGKYIKTISDQWIASEESPVTFNFIVLRTVPLANSITANTTSVGFIRKTILVDQDTNELELDLMYNKTTDAILVFKNSVLIEAEEDYTIDMDRQVLINPKSNWVTGTLLNLMVFKSVPMEDVRFDGNIIADGSIPVDKLSPEFNLLINNVVKDFQTSIAQVNDDINYQTAGGTGTAITLRLGTLKQGYNKTFIAIANNNGVATTVNGKPLYKPNTKIAPTLISGKAYTIWYDEKCDCFFFKASAEGDALSENVLATKKFSNDHDTGIIGTMPNNGTINASLNCGQSKVIPKGYASGGTITANSLASQTQANAVASDILISKNAWVNGSKITGTMPNNGTINATLNCGQSKVIPAGYTSGGTITANSLASQTNATAVASDILSGKTAWINGNKITGNMNDLRSKNVYCGAEGVASLNVHTGNSEYGQLKITPSPIQKPNGFVDHTTTFETHIHNLLPQNIKANVSIAGKMTGTFTSDANATAGDMLSGKTAYVKGSKITGSIPNRGEYQYAGHLKNGIDYLAFASIPPGYYPSSSNGSAPEIRAKLSDVASHLKITPDKLIVGTSICGVNGSILNKTNTTTGWCGYDTISVKQHPTDASQGLVTIPTAYGNNVYGYYGQGSKITGNIANLNANNIKAGVKVGRNDGSAENCITGTFTNDATATANKILSGQTAYVKGSKITGTMPNNGTINASLNCGQSKVIPAGYTSGGTITANSLASQTQANTVASDILSGKTAWVNGNKVTGNMANKTNSSTQWCGYESISVQTHPRDSSQGLVTIPTQYGSELYGYYGEGSKITGNIANLNPSNIKAGVKIGRYDGSAGNCITGTFTSDANAQASHILSGQTAYVNGNKITGNMPNRGGHQIAVNQYMYGHTDGRTYLVNWIPGGYCEGWQNSNGTLCTESWIEQSKVASAIGITPDKLISGTSVCGVNGNIPVLTGIRNATGVARWGDSGLAVYPERGYQKGGAGDGEIKVSQAQLINTYGINANKIVSGQEIAGVWGNVTAQTLLKSISYSNYSSPDFINAGGTYTINTPGIRPIAIASNDASYSYSSSNKSKSYSFTYVSIGGRTHGDSLHVGLPGGGTATFNDSSITIEPGGFRYANSSDTIHVFLSSYVVLGY